MFTNEEKHVLVLCGSGKSPKTFSREIAKDLFKYEVITYHLVGVETDRCNTDLRNKYWINMICSDGKRIKDFSFDLVISEFCPIHNLQDNMDSAFTIWTIKQIAHVSKLNSYLVVPCFEDEYFLFEVDCGDIIISIPQHVALYIDKVPSYSKHVAFVNISKLVNYIKKQSKGSLYSWDQLSY